MSEKKRQDGFRQTVGHALRAVLPEGTQARGDLVSIEAELLEFADSEDDLETVRWWLPPLLPSDVFAAAAYLCKIGGVIPFFEPSPYWKEDGSCRFGLTADERREMRDNAAEWRRPDQASAVPEAVFDIWDTLLEAWDHPITPGTYMATKKGAPDWWRAALKLVIISDLACDGLFNRGVQPEPADTAGQAERTAMEAWLKLQFSNYKTDDDQTYRPPATIAMMADSSIVCVMPKVRVAGVGATLRNVTRNICLLPGRGEVRCYWEAPLESMPNENSSTLDILLIPEPRELSAMDFVPHRDGAVSEQHLHENKHSWEYFDVRQNWIKGGLKRSHFIRDCVLLLKSAQQQSRSVNAVILPEYALDYELFDRLCDKLKKVEPSIEFVVSGSSSNCHGEAGNHVLTRIWFQGEGDRTLTQSRPKHHRWRMDRSQISAYALGASLNPKIENWWESTPLGRRELHFQRFRKSSVLSVLICEELARSDPCHEILRSIAPNLIVALLLDGPQLRTRWPAQYASNLADDPGTGVLTFTSFGLIGRGNDQGHHADAQAIALWKDDSGKLVEIGMPKGKGMRGILLSLWSEHTKDQTLCGEIRSVRAWRYSGHFPISIEK